MALAAPTSDAFRLHTFVGFAATKTQYYTAASLDGFIATMDDSLEWLFPLGDIAETSYPTFIRDVGRGRDSFAAAGIR